MTKIITVTLNPCIDVNYILDFPFSAGKLNRVPKPSVSYNGKGINVSRMLYRMGEESVCLMLSGKNGEAEEALEKEGLNPVSVRCGGEIRRNTAILDSEGVQTQINEPGMEIPQDKLKEFIGLYKSELNCPDDTKKIVILSGSIPPGIDKGIYKKLCIIGKNAGAYVILDCDGEALKEGLDAIPDLIKPNREEFEALTETGFEGNGEGLRIDAVRAALEFCRNNNCSVLLTLGEDGCVYAGPEGSYMCAAVKTKIRTFKGAGDSFLAAFVYEHLVKENECETSLVLASAAASRYLSE